MARIELRNTSIYLEDGFANADEAAPALVQAIGAISDPTVTLKDVSTTNEADPDNVVVGGRLRFAGHDTTYRITSTDDGSPNVVVGITPVLSAPIAVDEVVTFLGRQLEIKIGDGDLTWTEAREFIYDLDRGRLDTVRTGDDQPVSVDLAFTYEAVTAGTGEPPTPVDVLNQDGPASDWISSSTDPCEPYAVDIVALNCVPCGSDEDEEIRFSDFRYESLDYSIQDATISVSGQCNVTRISATRSNDSVCPPGAEIN